MGWVVPRIPLVSGARKHRSCFLEGERRAERHQRTRTAREKENSGSGQRRTTIDSSVASVEICLLPSRNFTNGWAKGGAGERESGVDCLLGECSLASGPVTFCFGGLCVELLAGCGQREHVKTYPCPRQARRKH